MHVKELDTRMKKSIRGSSYVVSDTKRYASKADGNLVPLQSLDHLTTTLTAKWCYSFLVNGHLKKYARAWLWELSALAKDRPKILDLSVLIIFLWLNPYPTLT